MTFHHPNLHHFFHWIVLGIAAMQLEACTTGGPARGRPNVNPTEGIHQTCDMFGLIEEELDSTQQYFFFEGKGDTEEQAKQRASNDQTDSGRSSIKNEKDMPPQNKCMSRLAKYSNTGTGFTYQDKNGKIVFCKVVTVKLPEIDQCANSVQNSNKNEPAYSTSFAAAKVLLLRNVKELAQASSLNPETVDVVINLIRDESGKILPPEVEPVVRTTLLLLLNENWAQPSRDGVRFISEVSRSGTFILELNPSITCNEGDEPTYCGAKVQLSIAGQSVPSLAAEITIPLGTEISDYISTNSAISHNSEATQTQGPSPDSVIKLLGSSSSSDKSPPVYAALDRDRGYCDQETMHVQYWNQERRSGRVVRMASNGQLTYLGPASISGDDSFKVHLQDDDAGTGAEEYLLIYSAPVGHSWSFLNGPSCRLHEEQLLELMTDSVGKADHIVGIPVVYRILPRGKNRCAEERSRPDKRAHNAKRAQNELPFCKS